MAGSVGGCYCESQAGTYKFRPSEPELRLVYRLLSGEVPVYRASQEEIATMLGTEGRASRYLGVSFAGNIYVAEDLDSEEAEAVRVHELLETIRERPNVDQLEPEHVQLEIDAIGYVSQIAKRAKGPAREAAERAYRGFEKLLEEGVNRGDRLSQEVLNRLTMPLEEAA